MKSYQEIEHEFQELSLFKSKMQDIFLYKKKGIFLEDSDVKVLRQFNQKCDGAILNRISQRDLKKYYFTTWSNIAVGLIFITSAGFLFFISVVSSIFSYSMFSNIFVDYLKDFFQISLGLFLTSFAISLPFKLDWSTYLYRKGLNEKEKKTLFNHIDVELKKLEDFSISNECHQYNFMLEQEANLRKIKSEEFEKDISKIRNHFYPKDNLDLLPVYVDSSRV